MHIGATVLGCGRNAIAVLFFAMLCGLFKTSLLRFAVQPYKDSLCWGHCMCWWFPWTKLLPRQHKVNSLLRSQRSVQVKLFPTEGLVLSFCSATQKLTHPTICSFQSLCRHSFPPPTPPHTHCTMTALSSEKASPSIFHFNIFVNLFLYSLVVQDELMTAQLVSQSIFKATVSRYLLSSAFGLLPKL